MIMMMIRVFDQQVVEILHKNDSFRTEKVKGEEKFYQHFGFNIICLFHIN